jgi:pimeloyl-ACP methyl ester carboxylesterase
MGIEVAELAAAQMPPTARVEYIDDAGHFLHLEKPDRVNALVVSFVSS